jgi:hypothetical protein
MYRTQLFICACNVHRTLPCGEESRESLASDILQYLDPTPGVGQPHGRFTVRIRGETDWPPRPPSR